MEKFAKELLAHLHAELREVPVTVNNNLQQYEKSYHIAEAKIKRLKEFMLSYSFKNSEEEIKYFKEINPLFYKEVIYFIELFYIETSKPIASGEDQKNYYKELLKRFTSFFDQYRDLYNYYLSGKDDLDKFYYLRSEIKIPLRPLFVLDFDSTVTTPSSVVLAHIQAYEDLCSYINNILRGDEPEHEALINSNQKTKLVWSSSKIDFLELAVGLYYSGSVNFGKGSLTSFVDAFGAVFGIQLGNVSRTISGMMIRKKEQTPFLLRIVNTVKHKIDEWLM